VTDGFEVPTLAENARMGAPSAVLVPHEENKGGQAAFFRRVGR
jgi:hypothetical protein